MAVAPSANDAVSTWPTALHLQLIRAAVLDGDAALAAWDQWRQAQDIETADAGAFAVYPKLYANLRRLGVEHPWMARLRGAHKFAWSTNQMARHSMLAVLRVLDEAGIAVMVLKGLPLLLHYYEDFGQRLMGDIDLLVHEADRARATAVLAAHGWCAERPEPPPALVPFLHALAYTHPRWRELDLHWRPYTVECPRAAEQALWSRAERHDVAGVPVLMPSPADQLVLTCYHARKSDPTAVCRWVIDVLMLTGSTTAAPDWSVVLEQTRACGLQIPVREALAFVEREFGPRVPAPVLAALAAMPVSRTDTTRSRYLIRGVEAVHRGLGARSAEHWFRYSRVCGLYAQRRGPVSFLRYLAQFYGHHWSVTSHWALPGAAARRLHRALAGRSGRPAH